MVSVPALLPDQLRRLCDPSQFTFSTTQDLPDLEHVVGQSRAIEALEFGMEVRQDGYNLFALGPPGTGKHSIVHRLVERRAATEPVPSDWCYVDAFGAVGGPKTLRLPAGRGSQFRDDMEHLVEELRAALRAAFESDDYRDRREAMATQLKARHEKALDGLRRRAETKGVGLIRTAEGLALTPIKDGQVLSPEEFEKLDTADQEKLRKDIAGFQEELQVILREAPKWEREHRDQVRSLNRDLAKLAVSHLLDELAKNYTDLQAVLDHLQAVHEHVLGNTDQLLQSVMAQQAGPNAPEGGEQVDGAPWRRYRVNLLIDNSQTSGAPVIYEDEPRFSNMFGRIEHMSRMGALFTDFSMIKAGALHRANGGYLVLDARRLLMQPHSYEGLKLALRSQIIRTESAADMFSPVATVSLKPQPIPLDVKVILVGEPSIYYQLSARDPDFAELFKVQVDFEDRLDRSPETTDLYAHLIATLARHRQLRPLDRQATARVIEEAARAAADSEKLTTRVSVLGDLLTEADFWAGRAKRDTVTQPDVIQALEAGIRRAGQVRDRMQEQIVGGTMLIATDGEEVGQINGLAVLQMGNFAFGKPNRITARVRLGKGEVVDIEREVKLGGALHSKGVLILSGYLGARFAADMPLSLSASLVFEQSYGGVDGDSASSAELYALLSALSGAPIRQGFAVTGSVNQNGEVQAIGGVNEKIEGFFDICRANGLTGEQGVMIPQSNVKHLMLRDDVVAAASDGKFAIYGVQTIDEGITILTGVPAGEQDEDATYPEGTINRRVADKLAALTQAGLKYAAKARTEAAS